MSKKEMWQTSELAAIAEITMGQSPLGNTCNTIGEGIPLLNGPTEFGSSYPSPVQHTTDPKKITRKGDLLFCVRGSTTGRMNWADRKYAIGRGLAAIRHNSEENLQPFIKAIIEYNLPRLLSEATGSTFPNVSGQQLKSLEIDLPPLPTQRRIAAILSSFDTKIELNRRMNATLEAMTQALFREMCMPKGDELPEGWEWKKIRDLVEIKHGFAFKGEYFSKSETENVLMTPGNVKIGGGFSMHKMKFYNGEVPGGYVLEEGDIIVTMTDLSKNGDTLGFPAIVPRITGKYFLHNQRLGKIIFNTTRPIKNFIYWLLRTNQYRSWVLGTATGSTVKHTSPSKIYEFEFHLPPNNVLEKFEKITSSFMKTELKNIKENLSLEGNRDALLPKLISGEIEV